MKPSQSRLRNQLLDEIKEPVYFQGFTKSWEILSWDLQKWSDALGDKLMPFRSGVKRITETPQWERSCQVSHKTMQEFIEFTLENEDDAGNRDKWLYFDYKYMHEWFLDHPGILKGISWERFGFPDIKGEQSTIWIGSDGAHTPCHFDTYGSNLVAQVYGMKQWMLFPPESSCLLSPTRVPYEESSVYSKLNFFTPEVNLMTGIEKAWVITLKPGDVLFVPPQWWHYVEHIGTAISVNTWLPLKTDFEKRLEESLIRLLVSHLTKEVSDPHTLLNPNEDDVRNCSTEECVALLEATIQQYYAQELQSNEKQPDQNRTLNQSFADSQDVGMTLQQYKECIQSVPVFSREKLKELWTEKRTRFKTSEESNIPAQTPVSQAVEKVINAVCHPDIISSIRSKFCEEYFSKK